MSNDRFEIESDLNRTKKLAEKLRIQRQYWYDSGKGELASCYSPIIQIADDVVEAIQIFGVDDKEAEMYFYKVIKLSQPLEAYTLLDTMHNDLSKFFHKNLKADLEKTVKPLQALMKYIRELRDYLLVKIQFHYAKGDYHFMEDNIESLLKQLNGISADNISAGDIVKLQNRLSVFVSIYMPELNKQEVNKNVIESRSLNNSEGLNKRESLNKEIAPKRKFGGITKFIKAKVVDKFFKRKNRIKANQVLDESPLFTSNEKPELSSDKPLSQRNQDT